MPANTRRMVTRMARNMLPSMVVNALLPAFVYLLLRRSFPDPNLLPIAAAVLFPVLGNFVSIVRNRSLDTFGSLMLIGFGVTLLTILVSGDQQLILVSRSLLTLVMGFVCLGSLLLPRPVSFSFAKQVATGNDPDEAREFDQHWQRPYVRRVARITSLAWGLALAVDFGLRVLAVLTLPVAVVLAVSPVAHNILTMGTMAWSIWYGARALRRGARSIARSTRSHSPAMPRQTSNAAIASAASSTSTAGPTTSPRQRCP